MCLTAKPTVEWTGSTVQVVPVGMGVEWRWRSLGVSLWLGIRTVVRLMRHCSTQTDRGPVILVGIALELPLINAEPPERADAARNRRARARGRRAAVRARRPSCVTMEAVAAEAGVGKGTVFRRFGDRASLARAIISEHETGLQEGMIRGPAPLGPGAPARERLNAFGRRVPGVPRSPRRPAARGRGRGRDLAGERRLRDVPDALGAAAARGVAAGTARTTSPTC